MDEPDKTERATLVDDDERAACNAVATRRFRLYLSVYLLTSLMRLPFDTYRCAYSPKEATVSQDNAQREDRAGRAQ